MKTILIGGLVAYAGAGAITSLYQARQQYQRAASRSMRSTVMLRKARRQRGPWRSQQLRKLMPIANRIVKGPAFCAMWVIDSILDNVPDIGDVKQNTPEHLTTCYPGPSPHNAKSTDRQK